MNAALLNNKAGFYFSHTASEPAAARPYLERALAIFEARSGSDHPNTATARRNLDRLLAEMGNDS